MVLMTNLGDLTKPTAHNVLGLDLSTNSLAFAKFENKTPVCCGEIFFNGSTVFERLHDAKHKVAALVKDGTLTADFVAIESAIMMSNIQVAIDLAYVYGAILGELMEGNATVHKVAPITWQSYIGNKNLTKDEKEAIKNEFPGKSKSWYTNKGRQIRKERTMAVARQHFNISSNSNNVSDAVGIALYLQGALTVLS